MNNEKLENILNLALNATPEEREKSLELNIGYDTACSIVNEAMKENKTIKEIVLEKGLLSNSLIDEILNNRDITSSGIAGESILKGTK